MTVAHICIGLALLTPYVFTLVAKLGGKGFDLHANHDPRGFLSSLSGFRKRADYAQQNSFEVVPAFAAAVLVAQQVGKLDQGTLDLLAIVFVVSRLAYGLCYVADWANLRSLMFFVGGGCIVGLFVLSA